MISEYGESLARHAAGGYVKNRRCKLSGDFKHIWNHEKKPLRSGEGGGESPGSQGSVDGSRGPRGIVKPFVAALARGAGSPIVPVGIAARPAFVWPRTWDAHIVPIPHAKLAFVYRQPIWVRGRGRERIERSRNGLQYEIDKAEARARALLGLEK